MCLILLLSSFPLVSAQQCETAIVKSALRKALFDYFQHPATATLPPAKIRDLLKFYLSISQGQITVNCGSVQGRETGINMELLVNQANAIVRALPKCSDGTLYGECSTSKPKYCYAGSLLNRCGLCGCAANSTCRFDGSCLLNVSKPPVSNISNQTTPPPAGNGTNQTMFCGDKICNGGEACNSCAGDCGGCPVGNVSNVSNSCTDSDGGLYYNITGTIKGVWNSTSYSKTDSCTVSPYFNLIEWSCVGSAYTSLSYNCSTGCGNGRCLPVAANLSNISGNTCTDSDGGKNYGVKGTSTLTSSNGTILQQIYAGIPQAMVWTDYCTNISNEILEYYCMNNLVYGIKISCLMAVPNSVCQNGVCVTSIVNSSNVSNTCTDTDGGIKYNITGTVSGKYNSVSYSNTDTCSDSLLMEWSCIGTNKSSSLFNCMNGCWSGQCLPFPEVRLTTYGDQENPSIYGDKIVWDYGGDIYLYDLSTNMQRRISPLSGIQLLPKIYGDKIVWQDSRNGEWDIYMYDLSTNVERQITTNSESQRYPAIYNDKIVWHDNRNGGESNLDIYLYDLSTNVERQITTNSEYQNSPDIYGDKIIWQDTRDGPLSRGIYVYDLSTNQERKIATGVHPSLYYDKMVWEDFRNNYRDIYLYDFSTDQELQITSRGNRANPAMYGDKIVWEDWMNGTVNIFLYDLSTGQKRQIGANSRYQVKPAIYENKVVWEDNRNGNFDIYMATIS